MAYGPSEIIALVQSYLGPIGEYILLIFQGLILVALLYWAYIVWTYDIKVFINEYSKNGRVITKITRAKEIKDKKTGSSKIRFFGNFGFGGQTIEKPPSNCIVPFKSRLTNKLYNFVIKDGLYFPIENLVIGRKVEFEDEDGNRLQGHTIDGSGLEISRDFDAEEAIQNNLINAALKYRNKDQRNQIYLSYGLMIVTMIIAGILMFYAIQQFGNLAEAVRGLNEPLKQGIQGALSGAVGPN